MRRWCPCCRAAGRCPHWWWKRVRLTTPQTKPTQRNLQAWPPPRYHAPGQYTPTNLTFRFDISNSSWSAWTSKVTSDPSVNCLCILKTKMQKKVERVLLFNVRYYYATVQIPSSQFSAVGGRDSSAEHQSPRADLQPAAGASADHPGEVHSLQGSGDLLPAQVSGKR